MPAGKILCNLNWFNTEPHSCPDSPSNFRRLFWNPICVKSTAFHFSNSQYKCSVEQGHILVWQSFPKKILADQYISVTRFTNDFELPLYRAKLGPPNKWTSKTLYEYGNVTLLRMGRHFSSILNMKLSLRIGLNFL